MENKEFKIGFNPMIGTIAQQLTEQGFKFNAYSAEEFENCRTAIFNLSVNSIINDKLKERLKEKLFKQIRSHVMEKNKMKLVRQKNNKKTHVKK